MVTFAVGIAQGITSYALFRKRGKVNYCVALGFTVFSLCSVGYKIIGHFSLFALTKTIAYVAILIVFTIPFASLRHKHDYENVPTLLFTFPYKCPILYIEQQYTTEHEKRSGEAFFDPVSLYVSSSFQVQTSGTLSPDS